MAWKSHDEIDLWQEARAICKEIWDITRANSVRIDKTVVHQMLGSSGSMMDNIAEGFGRGSNQEFKTFLGYSKGSAFELRSQLARLADRSAISKAQFDNLDGRLLVFCKRISALIRVLRDGTHKGFRLQS